MAEEETLNDSHKDSEHLQSLKDTAPVEPNKDELDELQYESAKESYDRALALWQEEVDKTEALLLVEEELVVETPVLPKESLDAE